LKELLITEIVSTLPHFNIERNLYILIYGKESAALPKCAFHSVQHV
jgi:hypothetical protein